MRRASFVYNTLIIHCLNLIFFKHSLSVIKRSTSHGMFWKKYAVKGVSDIECTNLSKVTQYLKYAISIISMMPNCCMTVTLILKLEFTEGKQRL